MENSSGTSTAHKINKLPGPIMGAITRHWPYILLGAVIILGTWLRFIALNRLGLSGDDTLLYWHFMLEWARGNHVYELPSGSMEVYRPVIFHLYHWAAEFFNYQDWSIKALNAGLDSLSMVLIYFVCRLLTRNNLLAVLSATVYAFLPLFIAFSRTELLHTASTTFILGAAFFLALFLQSRKPILREIWLGLSAVVLALSFGIHQDLVLFAPGFAAIVFLNAFPRPFTREQVVRTLKDLAVFLGCYLVTMQLFGFLAVIFENKEVARHFNIFSLEGLLFYREAFYGLIALYTSDLLFYLFLGTVIAGVFLTIYHRRKNEVIPLLFYVPLILILSYIVFYPLAMNAAGLPKVVPRLFMPGIPMVIIHIFIWSALLFSTFFSRKQMSTILVCLCLALVVVNFVFCKRTTRAMVESLPRERAAMYTYYAPNTIVSDVSDLFNPKAYPTSGYKIVYDFMRDKVDSDNKLLVTPYIHNWNPNRRGFTLYFLDNAVYVFDCEKTLQEYVAENNVEYILFAGFHFKPKKKLNNYDKYGLGKCYGMGPGQYTLKKEVKALEAFLKKNEASRIFTHGRSAIFALDPAKDK